jgi:putative FmdB family regulatory protein
VAESKQEVIEVPIYEYRCQSCGRKQSFFVRSITSPLTPVCRKCGSTDLRRLISRVAVLKSEESRMDALADSDALLDGLDENDPASVARWARKMSQETGEDLGPEFDEAVDRIEAGENPEKVLGETSDEGGDGSELD